MCVCLSILYVTLLWCCPTGRTKLKKTLLLAFLWLAFSWMCLSCLCLSGLGISRPWILSQDHAHDLIYELTEQRSLKWIGHEVPDHVSGWTPYQWHISLCNPIGDKEIPNVYVFIALADWSFSILLQNNRALVVLKQNVVRDSVSLSLQKIPCPTDIQHEVISAYQFSLYRAVGVEFLFCGTHNGKSAPQRQSSTGMPSHVRMESKRCVHPSLQNTTSVGTDNQQ